MLVSGCLLSVPLELPAYQLSSFYHCSMLTWMQGLCESKCTDKNYCWLSFIYCILVHCFLSVVASYLCVYNAFVCHFKLIEWNELMRAKFWSEFVGVMSVTFCCKNISKYYGESCLPSATAELLSLALWHYGLAENFYQFQYQKWWTCHRHLPNSIICLICLSSCTVWVWRCVYETNVVVIVRFIIFC